LPARRGSGFVTARSEGTEEKSAATHQLKGTHEASKHGGSRKVVSAGNPLRTLIAALAWSLLVAGDPLPAQEAPVPPLPGGGDIKPRELTPAEIEAQRKAQETWYAANLERFRPYLIKTFDQLAGESPVDGRFLSDCRWWSNLAHESKLPPPLRRAGGWLVMAGRQSSPAGPRHNPLCAECKHDVQGW